jgi:predicted alpha-1,2-mannosidase
MRRAAVIVAVLLLGAGVGAAPPTAAQEVQAQPVEDLARWVNPFVGTLPGDEDFGTGGGGGNTFPGAVVPFGLMQFSPDTVRSQPGGYFYDDNRIKGFSLTHLSGAGCYTYQDIPIMPFVGEVTTSPAADPNRYVSTFDHANEQASPGRYSVGLDSGASVELTATKRTGMARISYPGAEPATLLVNVSGSITGVDDVEVTIGRNTISGWATSGRFCGVNHRYRIYFHIGFDQNFASIGTWRNGTVTPGQARERGSSLSKVDQPAKTAQASGNPAQQRIAPADTTVSGPGTGAFVTFQPGSTVQARVGISFVSVDGARGNVRAESNGRSFERLATEARQAWNARLNQIRVTGGTDAQRTTFYTALYHSLVQPNVFSDADGRYIGFDGRLHSTDPGHPVYTNFSGWDVYRSQFQLLAVLAPAETSDIARSMVLFAEQGGSWDRWTVANGYTGVMVGDPYHAMVSTAYAFGATGFDAGRALLLMLRGATQPTQGYEERPGLTDYMQLGYVPMGARNVWGPAATTLEYTTADFAIAQLARRLGDGATYTTFMRRAQYWQNLFNPGTGYLQPRNRDGSFSEPFNPASLDGYVEGNGAQYTWMVPYNVAGLITAMNGDDAVRQRLDHFFTRLNAGPAQPHAFLGNEPSMQTPWLYNWAGAPWRAQDVARRAANELFRPGADGLVGNDDLGQMSSWYVWAAIGAYPAIPGRAELVLNSPLFERVVITRPGGQTLTIEAPGASATTRYVTALTVNGSPSTRPWLPESFARDGGTVRFQLSATPDPAWGSAPADAPPSFREGETTALSFVDPARLVIGAGGSATTRVGVLDLSGQSGTISWSAQPPAGLALEPSSGELSVPAGGRATQDVTVSVAAGTAEGSYRIPVTFRAAGGAELRAATLTVLVAEPGSLRAAFNNVGLSPDDNTGVANFDLVGWSYSADALADAGVTPGGTVVVDGLRYQWPGVAVGDPDNVIVSGQTVQLPNAPPGAAGLGLLGSATNGRASGPLLITYTDGSTQTAEVGFSDWTLGGGGDPISYGNRVAARMPYRNVTSGGSQNITTYLFATAPVPLQAGKQVRSVTLPADVDGGVFHVFAVAVG